MVAKSSSPLALSWDDNARIVHDNSSSKQKKEKGKAVVKPSSPFDDSSSDDNARMMHDHKRLRKGKVVANKSSSPVGLS